MANIKKPKLIFTLMDVIKALYPGKVGLEQLAVDINRNKQSIVYNIKGQQYSELIHRKICDQLLKKAKEQGVSTTITEFTDFDSYKKVFNLDAERK